MLGLVGSPSASTKLLVGVREGWVLDRDEGRVGGHDEEDQDQKPDFH